MGREVLKELRFGSTPGQSHQGPAIMVDRQRESEDKRKSLFTRRPPDDLYTKNQSIPQWLLARIETQLRTPFHEAGKLERTK